jgi:hypothetical protein
MLIIALLDACVLYPGFLRDLFMRLTAGNIFQPKWTDRIHAEWMENLLEDRPDLTRAKIERVRDLMNDNGENWSVPPYEHLIETLSLPDEKDRHVLAAGIVANAQFIVTFNLSDFPASVLGAYALEAISPDTFLSYLFQLETDAFLKVMKKHRSVLRKPPKSVRQYLDALSASRLPRLVSLLEPHQAEI